VLIPAARNLISTWENPGERPGTDKNIKKVAIPKMDPLYGKKDVCPYTGIPDRTRRIVIYPLIIIA
jgi:hypothetical protein